MLTLLLDLLGSGSGDIGPLRVMRFITVRAALALGLSFAISLLVGPRIIAMLQRLKAGQVIREASSTHAISLAEMHGDKRGTPTMGGLLILVALLLPVLLLCRLNNMYVILLILMSVGFAVLGFWDDYCKIREQHHGGVSGRGKLLIQACFGIFFGLALINLGGEWQVSYAPGGEEGRIYTGYAYLTMPFFKHVYPHLGWGFIPFVVIVMWATSNAVNLTDGLDGLAIGVTISNVVAFLIMAYLVSRVDFSSYLLVPHIKGGGEIVVFLAALLGSSMGFLWFNAHPASVFMGDTGSMLLGGALGTTAILLKQEMLLVVIGGIFVIECLSVILQVGSFKLRGKRIFRMSPLHHHFEKVGVHESRIIIRFWLISFLLAMAGLAMLKLR
jgi:phospho-N-acetylmuramoyl-pentapeptide-transferase